MTPDEQAKFDAFLLELHQRGAIWTGHEYLERPTAWVTVPRRKPRRRRQPSRSLNSHSYLTRR